MNVVRTKGFALPILLTLALAGGTAAYAGPITINNSSFETPFTGPATNCGGACSYDSGSISGWNTSGQTGQWITGGFNGNPNAFDGNVVAYTNGGSIWQNVGAAVAGVTYDLGAEVLDRTDLPEAGVVQLWIGGVLVATASAVDAGDGTWNLETLQYTATAGQNGETLTIMLSSDGSQGDFDDITLNASTPEPSSLLLLGTGLFGLAFVAFRKTKSPGRPSFSLSTL
jgi:PEP-CTERM motif